MHKLWLALLLLPLAAAAQVSTSGPYTVDATSSCTQSCSSQDFDAPNDPFAVAPGQMISPWTPITNESAAYPTACPFAWNSTAGYLERIYNLTGSCAPFGKISYARFNGQIAGSGCALFQLVKNDGGSGNATGWVFGLLLRNSGTAPMLEVSCNTACSAGVCSCAGLGVKAGGVNVLDSAAMNGLTEGGWMGACVTGNGIGTLLKIWKWTSDPGAPATVLGGGGWGDPTLGLVPCASGLDPMLCPSSANTQFGILMTPDVITTGAQLQVDHFRTYSCQ